MTRAEIQSRYKKSAKGRACEARYRANNPEGCRASARRYRESMSADKRAARLKRCAEIKRTEKHQQTRRLYLSKPEVRARVLALRRARYKVRYANPAERIRARISVLMRRHLKTGKENRSWRSLVDFTLEQLRQHLERQFTKGMSWDAFMRGEIEIDHILPIKSFKIKAIGDPEFKACWNLSNLRPLWAPDNNKKRAKIEYLV